MPSPDPDATFATILRNLSASFDDVTLDQPHDGESSDLRILDIENGPMIIISLQRTEPVRVAVSIPIGSVGREQRLHVFQEALIANCSPISLQGGVLALMANPAFAADLGGEDPLPSLDQPVLVLRREEVLAHLAADADRFPDMVGALITVAADWTERLSSETAAAPVDSNHSVIFG